MIRRLALLTLTTLVALLSAACAGPLPAAGAPAASALSADQARLAAAVQAELEALHAAGDFPGATATVLLADGTALQLAVGTTEAGGRPLSPEDRMLVGSVGKTWVAGLVHKLVGQGAFSYDDQAADWFADDAWYARIPNGAEVTIRQLLRHESGLERYEFKPEFWQELMLDVDRVWRPEELLAFVLDDPPMFPAGEGWAYADTNYILLGMILERQTGRRFYELAEAWIDQPLGLTDSVPSDRRRVPGMVQGTVVGGRPLGVGPFALDAEGFTYNVQFEWCGGGFASTSGDLASWARALFSERFLGPEGLAATLEAVPAPQLGPGTRYGLGVILNDTRLGPLRGHDGFMPGYLTSMGYFPELDIAAAVQLNTDDGRAVGARLSELLVRLVEATLQEERA